MIRFKVAFLLDLILCGALPGADQNMLKPNQVLPSRTFLSVIEAAPKKDTPLQTQCISVWKTDNK